MKVVILRGQRIAPGNDGHAYPGDVVDLDEKHAKRLIRNEDAVEHSSEAEKRVKEQLVRDKAAQKQREKDARAGATGIEQAIAEATEPLKKQIEQLQKDLAAKK